MYSIIDFDIVGKTLSIVDKDSPIIFYELDFKKNNFEFKYIGGAVRYGKIANLILLDDKTAWAYDKSNQITSVSLKQEKLYEVDMTHGQRTISNSISKVFKDVIFPRVIFPIF